MDGIESTKLETEDRCLLGPPDCPRPRNGRRPSEGRFVEVASAPRLRRGMLGTFASLRCDSSRGRRRDRATVLLDGFMARCPWRTRCNSEPCNADDVRNGMRPISASLSVTCAPRLRRGMLGTFASLRCDSLRRHPFPVGPMARTLAFEAMRSTFESSTGNPCGARLLVRASVLQTDAAEFDPLAPYRRTKRRT